MELKDFIGKVVISSYSKERYTLSEITGAYLQAKTEKPNEIGCYSYYCYESGTVGDPVSDGRLLFEDSSLTEPFIKAYTKYRDSEDGSLDLYLYYYYKE